MIRNEEAVNHLLGFVNNEQWIDAIRMFNQNADDENVKHVWNLLQAQELMWDNDITKEVWNCLPHLVKEHLVQVIGDELWELEIKDE